MLIDYLFDVGQAVLTPSGRPAKICWLTTSASGNRAWVSYTDKIGGEGSHDELSLRPAELQAQTKPDPLLKLLEANKIIQAIGSLCGHHEGPSAAIQGILSLIKTYQGSDNAPMFPTKLFPAGKDSDLWYEVIYDEDIGDNLGSFDWLTVPTRERRIGKLRFSSKFTAATVVHELVHAASAFVSIYVSTEGATENTVEDDLYLAEAVAHSVSRMYGQWFGLEV